MLDLVGGHGGSPYGDNPLQGLPPGVKVSDPKESTLGTRVQEALHRKGLSQNAFSKSIPTSASFINAICRDLKKPSVDVLAALVDLGVSGTWLLTGRGSMLGGDAQPAPLLLAEPPPVAYSAHPDLETALRHLRARRSPRLEARAAAYIDGLIDSEVSATPTRAAG